MRANIVYDVAGTVTTLVVSAQKITVQLFKNGTAFVQMFDNEKLVKVHHFRRVYHIGVTI